MNRVTVDDVPSRSYRMLERFLFLAPLSGMVLGVFLVVSTLGSTGDGLFPLGFGVLVLVSIPIGLVLALSVSMFLYLDAKKVRAQELAWQPSPGLYVVLGLLFSGLTVLHYVYTRQRYVIDRQERSSWWVFAVACPIGVVVFTALPLAGIAPWSIGLAVVSFNILPIAVYKDSTYVRLHSGWQPNPTMQYALALSPFIFFFLQPLYAAYYLFKRHRNLDRGSSK